MKKQENLRFRAKQKMPIGKKIKGGPFVSKKNKFDLTALVRQGDLKEGETLFFVSNPSKTCQITKQPNGEYKVCDPEGTVFTIHAFAQHCLETEPPNHASCWLKTQSGKTLYEIWHQDDELLAA